ncbi:co-chaperone GroES [Patescibacteria group bacterium]|nr:co-chaperone GroES [Patescibacteria group bacterium]
MSELSNVKPLRDFIVVEALEADTTTASGIVIPDTASKEKPQKGKVMAVGPGEVGKDGNRLPMDVKVGQVVLYTKYAPTEVKIDNKEYLLMHQTDLMAVIES